MFSCLLDPPPYKSVKGEMCCLFAVESRTCRELGCNVVLRGKTKSEVKQNHLLYEEKSGLESVVRRVGLVLKVRSDLFPSRRSVVMSVRMNLFWRKKCQNGGMKPTPGSLIKTSFLKRGTLERKRVTAPAPAPPHKARDGTHLRAAQ